MAQEVCTRPNVGSNIQVNLSNTENEGYYAQYFLNTAEPASCNGTISSVDYCYYGPSQYSNDNRIQNWAAVVALYHSEADGSYRRVSDGMLLLKRVPSNPLAPNPETDVLLNFNCDTYVLNSSIHVQKGDVFGALIYSDRIQEIQPTIGGLDLVGDSSDGYLMRNKSFDQFEEIRDLLTEVIRNRNTEGLDLPPTLDGLSLDTEKRVLHVYANISKSANLVHVCIQIITFPSTAPESDPSDVEEPVTENGTPDIIMSSSDHEISTQPPIAIESSPPYIKIIGDVLAGIVIIGTAISIATVTVILYKKWQKASFDLTTNEAYTERDMRDVHHIDYDNEADNTHEAIQHNTSDVNDVPLEQNAAYIVISHLGLVS